MPFDFEHKAKSIIAKRKQLKIGIVGFGTFGQFLAGRLVAAGHQVRGLITICTLTGPLQYLHLLSNHPDTEQWLPCSRARDFLRVCMGSTTNPAFIRWRPHAGVSNVQN